MAPADRRRHERHGAPRSGERAIADFIRIPSNKVPDGAEAIDFRAADGAALRGAIFPAPRAKATAVLALGRAEFIEKYFEVADDLRRRGFSVAALDWRGQGLSQRDARAGSLGHVGDFADFRSDLAAFMASVVRKRLAPPFVLLTHSMGGTPALQMLADGDETFCAAVLSAPMTRLDDGALKRLGVRFLARAACSIGFSVSPVPGVKEHSLAFEGNVLTSDPARHARFRDLQAAAPNAIVREPTYGWVRAAMAAMDDLHRPRRFMNLKTPTLIVSAGNDQLVRSGDHQSLCRRSPLIACVTIDGALHEIMMERDEIRDQYWKAFDDFVAPRLCAAAPAPAAAQMTQP